MEEHSPTILAVDKLQSFIWRGQLLIDIGQTASVGRPSQWIRCNGNTIKLSVFLVSAWQAKI